MKETRSIKSTASPQVQLLDEAFYFPRLNVRKQIWIYLPATYKASIDRYPVIYMHDGQNIFDEATSVGHSGSIEWMVDETIDSSSHDSIVVGIEHAPSYRQREQEYRMEPSEEIKDPRGALYLADIVHTLKPYIDSHFRTLPEQRSTAMVGSSFGGLLTLYAGIQYNAVFGTLGVFSPSFWMGHRLYEFLKEDNTCKILADHPQRYYFYAGGQEVRKHTDDQVVNMADDMKEFIAFFKNVSPTITVYQDIDPLGKHGALYWQKAFVRFFKYLFLHT